MVFPDDIFLLSFSTQDMIYSALLFLWAGFVRSGLGFGGAALGLPLMLFIYDQPLFWLPVIGSHLLFFSAMTLRTRIHDVDWAFLKFSAFYIIPAALVGVFGLITLPSQLLVYFIYGITLFYAVLWLFSISITSRHSWSDKLLLAFGGYVAGTSLTGAPLMVSVFMRHVSREQLRNTLFVLWFILVSIKMLTFLSFAVPLHFLSALLLIPAATVGHVLGLKAHETILQNDALFKRVIGGFLLIICVLGLWHNS
ncbi:MAG: TSUP family transporter [Gammaproteobacteria bacterium]|nr:TSUP family transporter [Gammaproteobacteria bacterium]